MKLTALLLTGALAALSIAQELGTLSLAGRSNIRRCVSPTPAQSTSLNRLLSASNPHARLTPSTNRTIHIPVYFHVITGGHPSPLSSLPNATLHAQLSVLNSYFSRTNPRFVFELIDITRTENKAWSNVEGTAMYGMGKALRRGNYGTLNVYFVNSMDGQKDGFLGLASVPLMVPSYQEFVTDGVWNDWQVVPGYGNPRFGMGITLVHEVGHWLGLLHTFDGGCNRSPHKGGDFVDDTPAEDSPAWGPGCNAGRDTCVGEGFEGVDPVENPMDYGDDECIRDFTPGQWRRMERVWDLLRPEPNAFGGYEQSEH